MGKDLKGRELGRGLIQRKDGRYSARFRSRSGARIERYFSKPSEAKQWLLDARYADAHGNIAAPTMTVDEWYGYWIENIKKKTVKKGSLDHYKTRYRVSIRDHIGDMVISNVRPMHCQQVLNVMDNEGYSGESMETTRYIMKDMFDSAVDNDIIPVNPVKRTVRCVKKERKERRVLTVEEQALFLEYAEGTWGYAAFVLALETGMRAGELIGLRWKDIDLSDRLIHVRRTMAYDRDLKKFVPGTPKSKTSNRDIPMTQVAYDTLMSLKERSGRKAIDTGYDDLVLLNNKEGKPASNSAYDWLMTKIAKENGMERFSMHTLRHTFATRCIEAGVNPKALQRILGHSKFQMTMDLYVHVTEEQKVVEMKKFEEQARSRQSVKRV